MHHDSGLVRAPERRALRHAAAFVAAFAIGIPALSGCGGDAEAESSSPAIAQSDIDRIASAAASVSSMPSAAKTSTGSGATTSARPSASGSAATDFVLPEAAKAHTKDGAKAFVQFYWKTLDALDAHPQDGVLQRLAVGNCSACVKQAETIADNARRGVHFEGSRTELTSMRETPESTVKEPVFTFTQSQTAATRVERDGHRRAVEPLKLKGAARLTWFDGGWRMGAYGVDPA